ncbi:MAG: autotransporter-associated beta strand repeat-containing protein [Chthoniobacterales bacterium]
MLAASTVAHAVTPISFTGTTYTQNFDTLPYTGTPPTYTSVGPNDVPTSTMGISLEGWSFYQLATSPISAFFISDGATNNSFGSMNGGLYSFGAIDDVERSLGSVASSSNIYSFGATFTNNTASTLTSFSLAFIGEEWRDGSTTANTLTFAYSLGAANVAGGGFSAAPALNFVTPVHTGSNQVNGNLPVNQTAVSSTISGFFWEPGTTLTIRWTDANDAGNDAGIAIDNLSFSAAAAATRTLVWNSAGGTWDTTTANWTGDSTVFATGDVTRFLDGQQGVVNIDAGGVTPGKIKVENTTGTYTLQGGAVTGGGSIIKSGAGVLAISSDIQATGGLTIDGGTVQTLADERLANAAPVTVNSGAKLDLQGHKETVGGFFLSGGTIDSGAAGQLIMGANSAVLESPTPATITGRISSTNATFSINVGNGSGDVDLEMAATMVNGQRIVFGGAGTTRVSGDNSAFTSGVTLNAGRLIITSKTSLGGGSAGTGQFFLNGGTFKSEVPLVGTDAILHAVSVGGNVTIDATQPMELKDLRTSFGGEAALMTVVGDLTVSGPMTLAGSVINKGGAGTLTLTAANTYGGTTFVRAGTLKLAGSGAITSSPTISVTSGATIDLSGLAGAYAFSATQVVQGGGTFVAPSAGLTINGFLSPGGSADGFLTETLTMQGGPVTLGSGAFSLFDITGTTDDLFDQLAVLGQMLTLDGQLTLSLGNGFVPAASDEFTIISSDGGISGLFANVVGGRVAFDDGSFLLTQDGTSVVLSDFAPVPEPQVTLLLAFGIAIFSIRTMLARNRA